MTRKICAIALCFSAIVFAKTPEGNEPYYSEAEKQELVDESVRKFAKAKHEKILEVPVSTEGEEDYLKGKDTANDPLESFNRAVHVFNGILDMILLEPLAYMYRDATPDVFQSGVSNFCANIYSPLHAVNHLLQANMNDFFQTTCAFVINTVFGGFGLVDMAEDIGFKRKKATFDQTLACWGMESGPYLVLPIFGATSFRGALGIGGDMFLDPVSSAISNEKNTRHKSHKNLYLAVWGIDIVDKRAKMIPAIEEIKKAPDPYIAVRSAAEQRRIAMEEELKSR
ncbi:MAG: hypothetical protein CNLJKLNK_00210 [Holosporales bacterium]